MMRANRSTSKKYHDRTKPQKSRLSPIFLEHLTQTRIFLCVLAYHLLVSIEKRFLDDGVHTSWWTLRQQLSTHQVITVALPTPVCRQAGLLVGF
jgi:predicted transporter